MSEATRQRRAPIARLDPLGLTESLEQLSSRELGRLARPRLRRVFGGQAGVLERHVLDLIGAELGVREGSA